MAEPTTNPAHDTPDTPGMHFGDGTGIDQGIDYSDERFIDPDHLDAHRARTLPMWYHRNGHTAVVVAVGDQAALIDRGIAYVIHAMWQHGIHTTECCEDLYGDDGAAMVIFERIQDAELFLSLVCPQDDKPFGLWDRATGSHLHAQEILDDEPDTDVTSPEFRKSITWVSWNWRIMPPQVTGRRVSWELIVDILRLDLPEVAARLHLADRLDQGELEDLTSRLYRENK